MFAPTDLLGGGAFDFLLVFVFWVVHFGLSLRFRLIACRSMVTETFESRPFRFPAGVGHETAPHVSQVCVHARKQAN